MTWIRVGVFQKIKQKVRWNRSAKSDWRKRPVSQRSERHFVSVHVIEKGTEVANACRWLREWVMPDRQQAATTPLSISSSHGGETWDISRQSRSKLWLRRPCSCSCSLSLHQFLLVLLPCCVLRCQCEHSYRCFHADCKNYVRTHLASILMNNSNNTTITHLCKSCISWACLDELLTHCVIGVVSC